MKRYGYILLLVVLAVGSFLVGFSYNHRQTADSSPSQGRRVLYYVDPMNPTHTSPKPGVAPCGMKMEPVYADEGQASGSDTPMPLGTVKITPEKQQIIGVRVATVEKAPWTGTLRVLGRVVPDETRIYKINAATDGWVKKMLPVTTGALVKTDELLATFYAPEFFSAMKAYLYGLRSMDRFQQSNEKKEQLDLTDANIENYRNALRNLGMTDHQLDEIMRTRKGGEHVEIRAPASGFVLARNITMGERFQRGAELYRIADLSRVWILTDVFENESGYFRPGYHAKVTHREQNRTFAARVSDVPPQFDGSTRALKVRLEADNPGFALRPDMFVDVELPIRLPPAIVVPADAILDSGLRKTVFVDRGNGFFEPRRVETGRRLGGTAEIAKGLMAGERIVVSGNFLIDSESKMRMAAAGAPAPSQAAQTGARATDPVCGMEVDAGAAKDLGMVSVHDGTSYYFCSAGCKEKFEKNPKQYLLKDRSRVSRPTHAHPGVLAQGSAHD